MMKNIITLSIAIVLALNGFAQKADSTKHSTIKPRGIGTSSGVETQPLIIIDGHKQYLRGTSSINGMDPNAIESINILKDSSAYSKYGPEGFAGVIEIKTKQGFSIPAGKGNIKPDSGITTNPKISGFYYKPKAGQVNPLHVDPTVKRFLLLKDSDKKAKPLYVVDGKEVSDISNLKAETIHSVTVIKDADAANKYSGDAKNGVVIITTKNSASKNKK